jgi:hypothetical protein
MDVCACGMRILADVGTWHLPGQLYYAKFDKLYTDNPAVNRQSYDIYS